MPKKRTPGKRNNVTLELSLDVQDQIDSVITQTGLDKKEFVRRLIGWYFTLPDVVRADALGHLPAGLKVDVAKILLERMRNGT